MGESIESVHKIAVPFQANILKRIGAIKPIKSSGISTEKIPFGSAWIPGNIASLTRNLPSIAPDIILPDNGSRIKSREAHSRETQK
jgi:hypothetical protein